MSNITLTAVCVRFHPVVIVINQATLLNDAMGQIKSDHHRLCQEPSLLLISNVKEWGQLRNARPALWGFTPARVQHQCHEVSHIQSALSQLLSQLCLAWTGGYIDANETNKLIHKVLTGHNSLCKNRYCRLSVLQDGSDDFGLVWGQVTCVCDLCLRLVSASSTWLKHLKYLRISIKIDLDLRRKWGGDFKWGRKRSGKCVQQSTAGRACILTTRKPP